MYLVSCRRKLFSPYFFSSKWEVLCIPSYPKETNLEKARLSEKTISELCWGKRVLVLVHGYNSDGAGLLRAYSTVEQRVQSDYDVVLGFLWPGSRVFFGYFTAQMRTSRASEFLAELLRYIRRAQPRRMDVNAHSLGCRILAKAAETTPVDLAIYLGAAFDRDEATTKYPGLKTGARSTILAWSATDPVLGVVYPFASRKLSVGGSGLPEEEAAKIPNLRELDLSGIVDSHIGYRHSEDLYSAWKQVLMQDISRQEK